MKKEETCWKKEGQNRKKKGKTRSVTFLPISVHHSLIAKGQYYIGTENGGKFDEVTVEGKCKLGFQRRKKE